MQSGIGGIGKKRYRLKKVVSCRKKWYRVGKKWYRLKKKIFPRDFPFNDTNRLVNRRGTRKDGSSFYFLIIFFPTRYHFFSNDTTFFLHDTAFFKRYHFLPIPPIPLCILFVFSRVQHEKNSPIEKLKKSKKKYFV